MSNRMKWTMIGVLVLVWTCFFAGIAQAQEWQSAYLNKLQSVNEKRMFALVDLTGDDVPEMAALTVDAAKTAAVKVYTVQSGKAVECACQGYGLDSFRLKKFSSAKMYLYSDAAGTPCLYIAMKNAKTSMILAMTSPAKGKLKPLLAANKTGSAYQINGEAVTKAKYKQAVSAFTAKYAKRGSTLPGQTIAQNASASTVLKKMESACQKYQTFTTLKSIKLSKTSASLKVGKTGTLTVKRSPASAISQKAVWASSNPDVASVSDEGKVTALTAGKTVISVTVGKFTKKCTVTVKAVPVNAKSVKLDRTSADLAKGETLQLTAAMNPTNATNTLKWSSSKPEIASVSSSGLVKGLKKGASVITVKTSNGKSAACKVTVKSDGSAVIVDISQHNASSEMDWAKIAANVDLMILRCGVTRTYTEPLGIGKDDQFAAYAQQCRKYGIPFGVYYYGKCSSVEQAKEEARFTWKTASPFNPLFYVYDCEESCLNRQKIEAYMTTLQSLGAKKTGYYIAHNYYETYKLDTSLVDFIWIPRYGSNTGSVTATPAYPCDMHQYTSQGTVPGISGKVDLSRLMGKKTLAWYLSR